VVQTYVKYAVLKVEDLADQAIMVEGDAYTSEKLTHAVYRREDDLDTKQPNLEVLERLELIQP
jgi:hypothetical protein